MSSQHTLGLLMVVSDGYQTLLRIQGEHGRRIASTFVQNHCSTPHGCKSQALENEANARRLAACWNACQGIPIEVLEANAAGGLPWNVADQIDQRMLRRELVEVLRDHVPPMPPVGAMCHAGLAPQEKCANCRRIARAYAAIAKAAGDAA